MSLPGTSHSETAIRPGIPGEPALRSFSRPAEFLFPYPRKRENNSLSPGAGGLPRKPRKEHSSLPRNCRPPGPLQPPRARRNEDTPAPSARVPAGRIHKQERPPCCPQKPGPAAAAIHRSTGNEAVPAGPALPRQASSSSTTGNRQTCRLFSATSAHSLSAAGASSVFLFSLLPTQTLLPWRDQTPRARRNTAGSGILGPAGSCANSPPRPGSCLLPRFDCLIQFLSHVDTHGGVAQVARASDS